MNRRLLIGTATAAFAIISIVQQSFGRGSFASENPWSAEHIGYSLPSEIRGELRMTRKDDHALLEVSEAAGDAYVLRWNGACFSRFLHQQTIIRRPRTGIDNE
jgi:hypothetical protein